MVQSRERSRGTAWAGPVLVAAVATAALLRFDPLEFPLLGDRGYHVYLQQVILRGESIYAQSFMGYPPLALLLGAAAMAVGRAFAVPTFLAPRFLGMALAISSCVLLYGVARRALGSPAAGLLAGVVLAGSWIFGQLGVAGLEPKAAVVFFSLLGCAALQRRRPGAAGVAAGLAATCYTAAVATPAVFLASALWAARADRLGARRTAWLALRFGAGVLLGLAPSLLYLAAHDAWWDFWQRSVVVTAAYKVPGANASPLAWGAWVLTRLASERLFALAAAAGFAAFALGSLRALRAGPAALVGSWLDPRLGAVPLLSAMWVVLGVLDFQGPPDLAALQPWLAFWVAWLWSRAAPLAAAHWPDAAARGGAPAAALLLLLAAAYSLHDVARYRPGLTLAEERARVAEILAPASPLEPVLCFNAEEVYALSLRRAPARFLRANSQFLAWSHLLGASSCRELMEEQLALAPRVVVIRPTRLRERYPECAREFEARLAARGYRMRHLRLGTRRGRGPTLEPPGRVVWRVFQRPRARPPGSLDGPLRGAGGAPFPPTPAFR